MFLHGRNWYLAVEKGDGLPFATRITDKELTWIDPQPMPDMPIEVKYCE